MIVCTKCLVKKNEDEFSFKNKLKQKRQSICKICTRDIIREHYKKNREYYLKKAIKRNNKIKAILREHVWAYLKMHACMDCGEKDPIVLEFDHTRDKILNISNLIKNSASIKTIDEEINKCEVRCANCHRRKTAKDFAWHKLKFAPVA